MKHYIVLTLVVLIIASCAPEAESTVPNLDQLATQTAAAQPTSTPLPPTETFTITSSPILTATSTASLTATATSTEEFQSEQQSYALEPFSFGPMLFSTEQIDTFVGIADQRSSEGQFFVLVGKLTNQTSEKECIYGGQIKMQVDGIEYELKGETSRDFKSEYGGRDFPGYFQGQCIEANESDSTFLLFDIPRDAKQTILLFDEVPSVTLTISSGDIRADQGEIVMPTFTPLPTSTPLPTNTELVVTIITTSDVNIRSGPGVNYPAIDVLKAGQTVAVKGRNAEEDWVLMYSGYWISAKVVSVQGDLHSLTIYEAPPTPTIPPTQVQPPAPSDTDGDGYTDNVDACPQQGDIGYGVAGNGCPNQPPTDSDSDGFADNVDACPYQGDQGYGLQGNGCPNSPPAPAFDCSSYRTCDTFGSCSEVHNFLNACPQYWSKADGNRDGVPCESLCG